MKSKFGITTDREEVGCCTFTRAADATIPRSVCPPCPTIFDEELVRVFAKIEQQPETAKEVLNLHCGRTARQESVDCHHSAFRHVEPVSGSHQAILSFLQLLI